MPHVASPRLTAQLCPCPAEGTALAVFCYGEHAANCILDHRKAGRQRLLGPLADHCCCVLVSSSPQLAGAKVRVTR